VEPCGLRTAPKCLVGQSARRESCDWFRGAGHLVKGKFEETETIPRIAEAESHFCDSIPVVAIDKARIGPPAIRRAQPRSVVTIDAFCECERARLAIGEFSPTASGLAL
jgi:hypothetical protein